ncbi:uncharacterized protein LOC135823427 [Sycon ciliatum]|uniref:uncharacterized protein LOC135823427 n=1 Tax=Sycon ciliatum TaxID=27933 RepID=UPI0031F6C854
MVIRFNQLAFVLFVILSASFYGDRRWVDAQQPQCRLLSNSDPEVKRLIYTYPRTLRRSGDVERGETWMLIVLIVFVVVTVVPPLHYLLAYMLRYWSRKSGRREAWLEKHSPYRLESPEHWGRESPEDGASAEEDDPHDNVSI